MSDLRIRSEPVPDGQWSQPFLPPQSRIAVDDSEDFDSDFGPLLAAASRTLTELFGLAATVRPGRRSADGSARCAPALSALLTTIRLGGDPDRPITSAGGLNLARHIAAITGALDAAAAEAWPPECRLAEFDVEVTIAGVATPTIGLASIVAPPRPPRPLPLPSPQLHIEVLGLPMRLRVELASEMTSVAGLFPLYTGRVLTIVPEPEMPLIIGQHRVGAARVTPLPDGRQQAEIIAIGVNLMEGRI